MDYETWDRTHRFVTGLTAILLIPSFLLQSWSLFIINSALLLSFLLISPKEEKGNNGTEGKKRMSRLP